MYTLHIAYVMSYMITATQTNLLVKILKKDLTITAQDVLPCADPENYVSGGPTLTSFFLVDEGRDTISEPTSACQRNAGVPVMAHY